MDQAKVLPGQKNKPLIPNTLLKAFSMKKYRAKIHQRMSKFLLHRLLVFKIIPTKNTIPNLMKDQYQPIKELKVFTVNYVLLPHSG